MRVRGRAVSAGPAGRRRRRGAPATGLIDFLALRAIPGLEEVAGGAYRRVIASSPAPRVIGLDDPAAAPIRGSAAGAAAADAHFARDPWLGPLVAARPGMRVPGTIDAGELAVRAVLGQQVSVAAARTIAGRMVAAIGEPLPEPDGSLTHAWPAPEAIEAYAPSLPMPRARRRTVAALAHALGEGLRLDERADLLALPGIGPWTADYIAMRLGDPDAWLPTDVGVRHGLARLGAPADAAEAWRPFRSYAVVRLWAAS